MIYLINFTLLVTLVIVVWYFVLPWLRLIYLRAKLKIKLRRGLKKMAEKHKDNKELHDALMKAHKIIKNL